MNINNSNTSIGRVVVESRTNIVLFPCSLSQVLYICIYNR